MRKKLSIAMVVAAALVAVTTLLLGAFGVARYAAERNEKWARLRRENAVDADALAVSLALPIWNIDRAQTDRILEAIGARPAVQAVVVNAAGQTHARARLGDWLEPSDGKVSVSGLLAQERPIVFNNQRIGTVRLYATPKFVQEELRQSLMRMVSGIVALDVLLVLSVYFVLWRTVLRPLVAIEKYAAAVSERREPASASGQTELAAELETLRSSIETMVRGLREGERALKEETDFTEAAINSVPGAFFVRDRAGRLIRWNQTMERLRNVSDEELRTQMGIPLIHPDDRPAVLAAIDEVFERGEGEREARVVVNGEVRHYLLNARRMDRGGEAFLVGTGIDITERRRAEAERALLQTAIERSAVEWRQTFDSVQTPMIITDERGVIRRANGRAAELASADAAALSGTDIATLGAGPWSGAAELIASFVAGGQAEAEARDSLGRVWDVTVTPLFSEGSDHALIVVFWEITGIVTLQESLRRSERMSSMGALVAGVAHEVRNPLFGMTALLDAYADELRGDELAEFSSGLRQQVVRLIHLMRELLEFGRPLAITLTPGALQDVADDAIGGRQEAATAAGVTLHNTVGAELPAVPMDYGRLRQVFDNLIDNALQHAPAVRNVTIGARAIVRAGRTSIECTVEDDGEGILPDDLPAVFEPFFTRRERGTGLGLSIVQRIIEEHAGAVSAGNREGGGAVITMVLPAWSAGVPPPGQPAAST
jgi:PAS domain S-box-containing protein